jgi:hypothetical protein
MLKSLDMGYIAAESENVFVPLTTWYGFAVFGINKIK